MRVSLDVYAYTFDSEPLCSVIGEGESLSDCVMKIRGDIYRGLKSTGHNHITYNDVLALPSPVYLDK